MTAPVGPGGPEGGLAICRRVLGAWGRIELGVAVGAFCAVVIINIVQITLRYGFNSSVFWVQEISQLLMLVAYFVGTSCVFRARHYVIVQFFIERVSPRRQIWAYQLAQALTIAFCAVILFEALAEAPHQLRTYSVILHLPRFYAYLPLIIASFSMIVTSLYYAWAVRQLARRAPGQPVTALERAAKIA